MKYIRTKDGIYEFEKIKLLNVGAIGEVIKEANTIEELCDEFVCENIVLDNEQKEKLFAVKYDKIYGAIWTDNGLIYVAKINDEGELELI